MQYKEYQSNDHLLMHLWTIWLTYYYISLPI